MYGCLAVIIDPVSITTAAVIAAVFNESALTLRLHLVLPFPTKTRIHLFA